MDVFVTGRGNQEDIDITVRGTPALGSHVAALWLASFAKHTYNLPTKEEQSKQIQKEQKLKNKLRNSNAKK